MDDDPNDVELTLRAFKKQRIVNEVLVKRDGQEALDYLFAIGECAGQPKPPLPLLVMLDLHMPRVSGFEVLRWIRSDPRTKMVPVAILSSTDEDKDVLRSMSLEANTFLRKPLNASHFIEVTGLIGVYWLALARPEDA